MRPDIAEIKRQLKSLRAAATALKESYTDEPQQFEAAEDIELALGWALTKIRRLSDRQDASDADLQIPKLP